MSTLYLDIFSGISGDMFLGALIDLGVDPEGLSRELAKLELAGYHLHVTRGQKASISGVKLEVHISEHEHEHEHEHRGAHGGPLAKLSKVVVELSVFETKVPPRFRLY